MPLFCSNCHKLMPVSNSDRNSQLKTQEMKYCVNCQDLIDKSVSTNHQDFEAAKNAVEEEFEHIDKSFSLPAVRLFPFKEFRSGQLNLMGSIYEAVYKGNNYVVHAPTGLGKTVSVLTPALQFAKKNNKKIFFLTSRQTQHRIAIETLRAIQKTHSFNFSAVDIISKHKMCPRESEFRTISFSLFNELCKMEVASNRCKYYTKKGKSVFKRLQKKIQHAEENISYCKTKGLCPYKIAIELGRDADVIICDYNYIFSEISETILPKLGVELEDIIVIVDEAHNLPGRIREHQTYELTPQKLAGIVNGLKSRNKFLARIISEIASMMENLLDSSEQTATLIPKAGLLKKIDAILHSSLDKPMDLNKFKKYLNAESSELPANSPLRSQILNLVKFLEGWELTHDSAIRFIDRSGINTKLVVKILDVAFFSEPIFDKIHSAVLMSGTLYPPEMYAQLLGLHPDKTKYDQYSSPFPPENRLVLVDSSVTTAYQQREMNMYFKISVQIHKLLTLIPGNVAVFFTSYDFLKNIKTLLEQHPVNKTVLEETRNLTPAGKSKILNQLNLQKSNNGSVLLGVMGGSMAEGVDYPNGLLSGVIVVGLPLPPPSLELDALKQYNLQKFGKNNVEDYSSILPTMNKVLQAAGRSIRSSDDRSIIILMDRRFNLSKYKSFLPDDYQTQQMENLDKQCKSFFNN